MKRFIKMIPMLFIMACIFFSCDKFKDSNDYVIEEPVKELDGSWFISKATRNGLDITKTMDFKSFKITFNGDKSYTIENYIPFLVRQNGTWETNDIQYPTQLIFKEGGNANSYVSAFDYSVVRGERQITLSFSPGCHTNIYSYILERVSNN
ncbi:MAG: DUF5004 domain-containing protein [Prevotella sp.]|jgi:hypothetical protein|nr:DUF5004 domain-containing protein [Prevotella sp.]